MKQLKFEGELYNACAPRNTCDAWKQRTGRVVKDHKILNALGTMLIRGKDKDEMSQRTTPMPTQLD